MNEKIKLILIFLAAGAVIFLIIYIISLNNKIDDLKIEVIKQKIELRDSLIAKIQLLNKERMDTLLIKEKEIKYFEKDSKDYENYLHGLSLDSLIIKYKDTRPILK